MIQWLSCNASLSNNLARLLKVIMLNHVLSFNWLSCKAFWGARYCNRKPASIDSQSWGDTGGKQKLAKIKLVDSKHYDRHNNTMFNVPPKYDLFKNPRLSQSYVP